MTIPHVKQAFNRRFQPPHAPSRLPVRPPLASQGQTKPQGPATRSPLAALLLATFLLLNIISYNAQADTLFTETFEDDSTLQQPTATGGEYTLVTTGANQFVSSSQSQTSPNSFRYSGNQATNHAKFDMADGFNCAPSFGTSTTFWVYMTSYPVAGDTDVYFVGSDIATSAYWQISPGGQTSINVDGNMGLTGLLTALTFPLNTWVDLSVTPSGCITGTQATFSSQTLDFVQNLIGTGNWASSMFGGWGITFTGMSGTETRAIFMDSVTISGPDLLESNQVAVTNLVGYSMDPTGRTIIVRTNGGTDIATYSAADVSLGTVGTATTPTCNRVDGVLVESYSQEIFTVYMDCDGSGDTDTFKIRSSALGPAPFNGECENQVDDVEEGGEGLSVPNQIQQVGQILRMPFDFSVCSNTGINRGVAGWTFSETVTGNLGAYVALYQTGLDNDDTDTVQLDTSATPDIVQMCAWHDFSATQGTPDRSEYQFADGNDYMGGIADQGPIGIYRTHTSFESTVNPIQTFVPHVSLEQVFLNNGQFGDAVALACVDNTIIVLKSGNLYVLTGVLDGSPAVNLTKTVTSANRRGLAVTGSGRFMAYTTGSNIEVAWVSNGTVTSTFVKPSGTFMGMEFDSGGEKLAVFTSTLITVYETGPVTCEISNTCASEGGVGSDEPPGSGGGGGGGGDGGDGGGGIKLEDNIYFWVILWILIFNVLVAGLSWATRAGFGGQVYLMVTLGIYIVAILLNNYDGGEIDVNPWPVVAIVGVSVGFGITQWVRR